MPCLAGLLKDHVRSHEATGSSLWPLPMACKGISLKKWRDFGNYLF